jgi:hypothetical protein
VARGRGRILLEAWAIPDSRFFALWPLASRVNSHKDWVETYLAHLQRFFAKKWDHFGGDAPRSSPRGGLDFQGKAESPFQLLFHDEIYNCTTNWGVGYVSNKKGLEILPKGRSDVAIGCSKRW